MAALPQGEPALQQRQGRNLIGLSQADSTSNQLIAVGRQISATGAMAEAAPQQELQRARGSQRLQALRPVAPTLGTRQ